MTSDQTKPPAPGGPLAVPPARRVYCNRTLNLNGIRAIGFDMDYTLIHYHVEVWERRAFAYLKENLLAAGWPVEGVEFDPAAMIRGLVLDLDLGNLLKADRFGYVKKAFHGTRPMTYPEARKIYSETTVNLKNPRFVFLNAFFSLSELSMYAQLVDLFDSRKFTPDMSYTRIYAKVREALDAAHLEGRLKGEIVADPERFVAMDPELTLALLDLRHAGKQLLLITNSEWEYTNAMMSYAFNRFLPEGSHWQDLFDVVIISARKPDFFASSSPLFEVVSPDGLLKPALHGVRRGGIFLGGHAALIESYLGASGDQILYVGDHMYGDVHVSKSVLRWRTALVVHELEQDLAAEEAFRAEQDKLDQQMRVKDRLQRRYCWLQVQLQRAKNSYGPPPTAPVRALRSQLKQIREKLFQLDEQISPTAAQAGKLSNANWGLLMRTGNDKSLFARQVERYADIYLSRVSNFLYATPFAYFRSHRGSLPHDFLSPP